MLKSQKHQHVKAIGSGINMLQGCNNLSDDQVMKASSLLPKIVRKRKLKPEEDSKTLSVDNVDTTTTKRRLSSADEEKSESSPQPPHDDEDEEEEDPGMLKGLVAYSSGSEHEEVDDNPRGRSGSA